MAVKQVSVNKNMEQPNKMLDILGYFIFLISLCTMKNEFDRYHANQALMLAICAVALNAAIRVIALTPFFGWILGAVLGLVANLCVLALMIFGMINAANLECKPLPVIGDLFQLIQY